MFLKLVGVYQTIIKEVIAKSAYLTWEGWNVVEGYWGGEGWLCRGTRLGGYGAGGPGGRTGSLDG